MRYVAIIYSIKIDEVALPGITVHEIKQDDDMFVFAHNYLTQQGLERMFNLYFINKGQGEVTIQDVTAITEKTYNTIKELLRF